MSHTALSKHPQRGITAVALATFLTFGGVAAAQTTQVTHATPTRTDSASDSTTVQKPAVARTHSRFGHFGSMLRGAASEVQTKTGISGSTAARIAATAVTGGASAALINSVSSAKGAAPTTTLSAMQAAQQAAAGAAAHSATPNLVTGNGATETTPELRAVQDLSQISARASQGDPSAKRAMVALNSAMAAHNGQISQLEQRAQSGDPKAAQEMIMTEDNIARAALGEKPIS